MIVSVPGKHNIGEKNSHALRAIPEKSEVGRKIEATEARLTNENEKNNLTPTKCPKFKTGAILKQRLIQQSVLAAKAKAETFLNETVDTARHLASISEKFHHLAVGRGKITESVALELLNRLARGETLKSICKDITMPSYQQVMKWVKTDPDFQEAYLSAQEFRMNMFADEILEIADNSVGDVRLGFDKHGNVIPELNVEAIQRSKLRIDTRKYLMERYAKETYAPQKNTSGATASVGGNGQVNIQINLPSNGRPITTEVVDV